MNKYFIKKHFVKRVFLYGSYAIGNASSASDIDLIIDLDYEQLQDQTINYLSMATELSLLLSAKVSVATTKSFSIVIHPFTLADSIKIFDRDKRFEIEWPEYFDSFDKSEYRDLARLVHIRQSLTRILSWTADDSLPGFDQNSVLSSACLQELRIIAGLTARLTQSIKDEVVLKVQGDQVEIYNFDIVGILKGVSDPYFGSDIEVLKNVVKILLPSMTKVIDDLLKNWEGQYKTRLTNYFKRFLRLNLNSDVEFRQNLTADLEAIDNAILQTIEKRPIIYLIPRHIAEGERNLSWIASQLNIKKTWGTIKDAICPLFPIC